jgi:hypothetical protein
MTNCVWRCGRYQYTFAKHTSEGFLKISVQVQLFIRNSQILREDNTLKKQELRHIRQNLEPHRQDISSSYATNTQRHIPLRSKGVRASALSGRCCDPGGVFCYDVETANSYFLYLTTN